MPGTLGKSPTIPSENKCDTLLGATKMELDPEYPGTAVQRLHSVHERVKSLSDEDLSGDWSAVRRKLLWAGIPHFQFDGIEFTFSVCPHE